VFVILLPGAVFVFADAANDVMLSFQLTPLIIYTLLQYLLIGTGIAALSVWKPKVVGNKAKITLFSVLTACFLIMMIGVLTIMGRFNNSI